MRFGDKIVLLLVKTIMSVVMCFYLVENDFQNGNIYNLNKMFNKCLVRK